MKDILQPLINEFMPFAQKRMGFEKPPRVFLRDDPQNAQDPLGKTAYYDPEQMSVTLYIYGRHPKDVMRSLSHELVHHTQNCNGEFENTGDMGEGYAQKDPHLREMERKAYEIGNLCLRDWTDTRNSTIYNVSLQEGAKKKMSTKDWKNNELRTLLTEKWGFSFNLLNESQEEEVEEGMADARHSGPRRKPKLQKDRRKDSKEEELDEAIHEDEELEEGGAARRVGNEDRLEQRHAHSDRIHEEEGQAFAPNHYCVHHGGVERNGSVELAEAVAHNYNKKLGRVTHYDMKFADGTIMENVAFEDIQVTNASLALEHRKHSVPGSRDPKDELDEAEEIENKDKADLDDDGKLSSYEKARGAAIEKSMKDQGKKNEAQIRSLVRRLVKEAMNLKENK
jgi:hypothetical protein